MHSVEHYACLSEASTTYEVKHRRLARWTSGWKQERQLLATAAVGTISHGIRTKEGDGSARQFGPESQTQSQKDVAQPAPRQNTHNTSAQNGPCSKMRSGRVQDVQRGPGRPHRAIETSSQGNNMDVCTIHADDEGHQIPVRNTNESKYQIRANTRRATWRAVSTDSKEVKGIQRCIGLIATTVFSRSSTTAECDKGFLANIRTGGCITGLESWTQVRAQSACGGEPENIAHLVSECVEECCRSTREVPTNANERTMNKLGASERKMFDPKNEQLRTWSEARGLTNVAEKETVRSTNAAGRRASKNRGISLKSEMKKDRVSTMKTKMQQCIGVVQPQIRKSICDSR